MRYIVLSLILLSSIKLGINELSAIGSEKTKVKWIRSMKEYNALDSKLRESRPTFVDLWTDWCGWCVTMDKRTYSNDSVADFLNTHFIPLKFNAETKEKFTWRGTNFYFDDNINLHTFANFLTSGRAAFPTSVIIFPDGNFHAIAGFLNVRDIEHLLKFYALPNKERDFDSFNKNFKNKW